MRLKTNLLINILNGYNGINKYSYVFLNLHSVVELELSSGFEVPDDLLKEYNQIKKKYYNFKNGIPLRIIERYYYDNLNDLNKYVYIEYKGKEIQEYKVINIYYDLEEFYNQMFLLASKLADFYALDIKIKKNQINEDIF